MNQKNHMFHPLLDMKPDAIERLGKDVFVETPLYRAKNKISAVYVNHELAIRLFNLDHNTDATSLKHLIEKNFSTTIEPEYSNGETIGTAYIDRQSDPMDISLAGNLGSGRAYYVGKCFNIKGERTKLATSKVKRYANGYLEMERGMWETIIANALQNSIQTGLSPVLAILDLDKWCEVEWRPHPVRRVKIIRIDEGALDRITHCFLTKKPLSETALIETANQFANLEASKFAERILHGAWSCGNISLKGHFIDFDTVIAVKGRAPVYSFTQWHLTNYFGSERAGQLKIIHAMVQDKTINQDNVPYAQLEGLFYNRFYEALAQYLLRLMGFNDNPLLYDRFKERLLPLAKDFFVLSRLAVADPESLYVRNIASLRHHFFDFSNFFRFYPLSKRLGNFHAEDAFETNIIAYPFDLIGPMQRDWYDTVHLEHLFTEVFAHLDHVFLASEKDAGQNADRIKDFIQEYDHLFSEILIKSEQELCAVEANALLINEDRYYFLYPFLLTYKMVQTLDLSKLQENIEHLIFANVRNTDIQSYYNIQLYREGFSAIELNYEGKHRQVVGLYQNEQMKDAEHYHVSYYKQKPLAFLTEKKGIYWFAGHWRDNQLLLTGNNRNDIIPERFIQVCHPENNFSQFLSHY